MFRMTRLLVALLTFVAANASTASAVTINVDTVLGPDNPFQGYPIVVEDGPNPPTRVTILPGFQHHFQPDLDDYYNGLILLGSSEVTMLGGEISYWEHAVTLRDRSRFRMTGGYTYVEAYDQAEVSIEGGHVEFITAYDNSRIRFSSPQDGNNSHVIRVQDNAHAVILTGGYGLETSGSSTTVLRGGGFEEAYFAGGETLINGDVGWLHMSVSGGTVHLWSIAGAGSGPENPIFVGGGMLHVYGTDLRIEQSNQDPDLEVIAGYLADGDPIRALFDGDPTHVVLHEVPEPSSIALFTLAFAALAFARRFSR